jgi:hypothetical protein
MARTFFIPLGGGGSPIAPTTPSDVIADAYAELGILGQDDTPDAAQHAFALRHFNRLIDWLSTKGQVVTGLVRTTKVLDSGTASLTIGSDGDIDLVRPRDLAYASVIEPTTPETERQIAIYTDQQWAGVRQKTLTGSLLEGIYFDRTLTAVGSGLSTISLYPVPTVGTLTLVLYTAKAFPKLAMNDLSDTYAFAPGLEDFFLYNLAKRLAPSHGKTLRPESQLLADQAFGAVLDANQSPTELSLDPSLPGMSRGWFDPESNRWQR